MRNVIVLGSGRSGTSMLAGTLAQAGAFVGSSPYPPRDSNPKGFFESADVNGINEALLAGLIPSEQGVGAWQHWLARLPEDATLESRPWLEARIERLVAQAPWCFKDPRFCYTLPVWRPHLGDALFLCIFRDPAVTARSILKEHAQEDYLTSLPFDREAALETWDRMYRQVLDRHRHEGEWMFLHYDQVLSNAGLERIEATVGTPLPRSFPDAGLRRTRSDEPVPESVAQTYAELCELAGHPCEVAATSPAPPREVVVVRSGPSLFQDEHDLARDWVHAVQSGRASIADPDWSWASSVTVDAGEQLVVQRLPELPLWELQARREGKDSAAGLALAQTARVEGLCNGLRELGASSMAELEALAPWPIATDAEHRFLAWPTWSDERELDDLLARFGGALADRADACLCLRHDGDLDGPVDQAFEHLQAAYDRRLSNGELLNVVLLTEELDAAALERVGRAVDAALRLPSSAQPERDAFLAAVGSELIETDEALLARLGQKTSELRSS